jgi:putative ABC transport system substrate-binding protein
MPSIIALALLLSLASFAGPSIAEAQTAKPPLVGVLSPWNSSLDPASQREPFERGLRELGWIPGVTIVIVQRYAAGKLDLLPPLAAELVQMRVDVIVAHGTAAIRAARQSTTTILIVMSAAGDPVREGFVQGLARPDGNVTGLTFLADGRIEPKQLQLLKEAIPGLSRVGVLANRSGDQTVADEINAAAGALALRVQTFEVSAFE